MKVKDVIEELLKLNPELDLEFNSIAGRITIEGVKSFVDKRGTEHVIMDSSIKEKLENVTENSSKKDIDYNKKMAETVKCFLVSRFSVDKRHGCVCVRDYHHPEFDRNIEFSIYSPDVICFFDWSNLDFAKAEDREKQWKDEDRCHEIVNWLNSNCGLSKNEKEEIFNWLNSISNLPKCSFSHWNFKEFFSNIKIKSSKNENKINKD